MTKQQIASLARQVGAAVISAGYTALIAAGHTKGIPAAVDAVVVAFGPAVIGLEHYLSDPSTGTPPAPPSAVPDPTPAPTAGPVATIEELVKAEVAKLTAGAAVVTAPAGSHPSVTVTTGETTQPAPVPPPQEWSTMAAQASPAAPVAPPAPNPAPPAPQ